MKYTDPEARICRVHPEFLNVPLIPVQLFASLADLLLFFLCCIVLVLFPYSGLVFLIFIIGVNLKRILIQSYRYRETSSYIPYRRIALGLLVAGMLLLVFFRFSGEVFFAYTPTRIPFTVGNFVRFMSSDVHITASLLVAGALNFFAYGIHSRKLGKHFNIDHDHLVVQ